jgi:hypothetical protein
MDDPRKDRLDERVQENDEDAPNPEERLDERVEQIGAPPDRLQDEDDGDDGPVAA